MTYINKYKSPLGVITMASDEISLTGLWFNGQKYFGDTLNDKYEIKDLPIFDETKRWLDIYFKGENPSFMPKIKFSTTPFRKRVWEILETIPYGKTITYGEIANIIAKEKCIDKMSARAVGGAVGHNPISIIVPCHRVIGTDGSLTGYAGGIYTKIQLLKLEKVEI